ncbi:hypothetical protein ACIP5N_27590 [Streptomyces sp. NPDC088768]|uniref:hypothetical protein n=1 Tax=Streptomyces sp. NPDC088768 TaxID=3365894 RepID=UPI0038043340
MPNDKKSDVIFSEFAASEYQKLGGYLAMFDFAERRRDTSAMQLAHRHIERLLSNIGAAIDLANS